MIRRRLPEHQPSPAPARRRLPLPAIAPDLLKALTALQDPGRALDPLPKPVMGRLIAMGLAREEADTVSYGAGIKHTITHQMLTDLGLQALAAAPAKQK